MSNPVAKTGLLRQTLEKTFLARVVIAGVDTFLQKTDHSTPTL